MGTTKTALYADHIIQIANWAKALGHPARIAIIQYLLQKPGCMCGDIVQELPLAQATVSQHLKALKEAGIIQGEIDGTSVCYCINPEVWQSIQNQVISFMQQEPQLRGTCAC